MNCSNCGAEVNPGAKFCPDCGTEIETEAKASPESAETCAACGVAIRPGAKFCQACGAPAATVDPQQVYNADWDDVVLEEGSKGSNRNLKATLLPILLVPILVGVFYVLSKNKQNPKPQQAVSAQQSQVNKEQMQQVYSQIDSLRQRLKEDPKDTTALLFLGEMYTIASRFDEAHDYFSRYLKINPDNFDVQMRIANIYFNQKKFAAAESLLKSVLLQRPDNAYVLYNYALTLHLLGDIDGAVENWQKAIKADPGGNIAKQSKQAIETLRKMQTQK